jgi:malonate decarboxylase delta subunit
MDEPAGLETLTFAFASDARGATFAPVLVGVVGSGNLEVLIEPASHDDCRVTIETSARGFARIWEAVFSAFHERFAKGGVAITVHDMGATPAVVSLRLDQAAAAIAAQGSR